MCFAAVQPFIVYLCEKRIFWLYYMHMQSIIVNGWDRTLWTEQWTNSDSFRCHFWFENVARTGLCNVFRVGVTQIVRDLVYLLVSNKLRQTFQQVNVYRADLTIIFWVFVQLENFLSIWPRLLFQCAPIMCYLHIARLKTGRVICKMALRFVDTTRARFPCKM